jgi:hypothetical protein
VKGRGIGDVALLLVAALFIGTSGHVGDAAWRTGEPQRDALEAAVSAIEQRARERQGRHAGFDTYKYPGDEVMRAWWHADVPYEWVGYYLPAPCHKDSSWSGKRETLERIGWGMAVIYVGQQAWDQAGTPAPKPAPDRLRVATTKAPVKPVSRTTATKRAAAKPAAPKAPPTCSQALLSAERGRLEADDAIRKTEAEGFARGTVIFLDIEYMTQTPRPMRDYYVAWTRRVLEDGRYRPGYYAHKRNADVVYDDVKPEFEARGVAEEPRFWIAGGRAFSPDREPHEVGRHFAKVWQGVLDVTQSWNGHTLPIDVNVAHVPSPSTHDVMAGD